MTIVILAAGQARRMGAQKLLLPIDGQPMLARVRAAAGERACVVVIGDERLARECGDLRARIVINTSPERGMSHSLALADATIAPDEPIAVLLGDLPDLGAHAVDAVVAAYADDVDVVAARYAGDWGHPVVFGPRARRRIASLPTGDTLRRLRDDPNLRRRIVDIEIGSATDIDTPADYVRRMGSRASLDLPLE